MNVQQESTFSSQEMKPLGIKERKMNKKKKFKIDGEKVALWVFLFVAVTAFIAMGFPQPKEYAINETPKPQKVETIQIYNVPLEPELQEHINNLCDSYGVGMPLVLAIIGQESNYNAHAVGDNGNSLGLMQIQPQYHQARMDRLGMTDLLDPHQNVTVGIDLLAELIGENNGTEWAVTAYNAGAETADYNKTIGTKTEYTESVMMLKEMIENDKG